ncbi:hypothetical protein AA11825_2008 [Acetobacter pomorum DSM 11825]|uniref:hypothetical protein n=1 Tax=Acetobacter pomorum TaxID=65959 RepID=UPI00185962A6|nr:hypothetical protein [Acetobacter pomorum]GBR51543.1 hypothetical protein AA11825_2008 [Acetobacter pomorum DSM 11825]
MLLTAVGRQRTGKTVFLNALTETVMCQGGDVEVWNTDHLNVSHSISHFHPNAKKPATGNLKEQKSWLRAEVWFYRSFPEFLAQIDPSLLPDMPKGLPVPRDFE